MVENDIEAQDLKELAPVLGGPPWAAGLVRVDQARVSQDHSLDNDILWGGESWRSVAYVFHYSALVTS